MLLLQKMALPTTILKRALSTSSTLNVIKNVTVIGGGLMGSGIAQVSSFFLQKRLSSTIFLFPIPTHDRRYGYLKYRDFAETIQSVKLLLKLAISQKILFT